MEISPERKGPAKIPVKRYPVIKGSLIRTKASPICRAARATITKLAMRKRRGSEWLMVFSQKAWVKPFLNPFYFTIIGAVPTQIPIGMRVKC